MVSRQKRIKAKEQNQNPKCKCISGGRFCFFLSLSFSLNLLLPSAKPLIPEFRLGFLQDYQSAANHIALLRHFSVIFGFDCTFYSELFMVFPFNQLYFHFSNGCDPHKQSAGGSEHKIDGQIRYHPGYISH